MTDPELVLRKLAKLREFAQRAERRRPVEPSVLVRDTDVADALCLALLVATQEAVDIAMHVSTDEGWAVPDSQRDAFDTLAARGVIPEALAAELAGVVAVRNRIAHGYGSVDHERLWSDLPAGVDALRRYATSVAAWLDTTRT